MKNSRILAAILCLVVTVVAAPALAEDYPGADLQQADQLEAQASEAIESGRQRHADTRTAEFLFQKAQYEVSARHGQEAKRYFLMAIDAMRPDAPAPVEVAAPAGETPPPTAVVSAPEEKVHGEAAIKHVTARHHRKRTHRRRSAKHHSIESD